MNSHTWGVFFGRSIVSTHWREAHALQALEDLRVHTTVPEEYRVELVALVPVPPEAVDARRSLELAAHTPAQ